MGGLQKVPEKYLRWIDLLGGHCIKTWSKTQAVIAKSSAESELYGVAIVKV